MTDKNQINQIINFLDNYPRNIVETSIILWRNKEIIFDIEGMITDIQLDKPYHELNTETKLFIKNQSEPMIDTLPYCKCGKQLNLIGICSMCKKGKEGWKSKFVCSCGYEEYFKEAVREKVKQLGK